MIRPKPTKDIIMGMCGSNQGLVSAMHHGLYESSLAGVYPVLDLNEALAFAASSWEARRRSMSEFRNVVDNSSLYELFSEVFKIGMPWLNKHKAITPELVEKYTKLNPFEASELRRRLDLVPQSVADNLRIRLSEEVNQYVFHCQYQDAKRARGGDNHKLEIMAFQNVYPKSGKIVPAFAGEVARIVGSYSRDYQPLTA